MILVLGSSGFVGKAMCRRLKQEGVDFYASTHQECDLMDSKATQALFEEVKPDVVINLAALLGGVHFGYAHAAEMFRDNMLMQINVLEMCRKYQIRRLINPIGSCVYPGELTLFTPDKLWNGPIHESVLAFGTAKKAFLVACWAYRKQYGLDSMNLIMSNMYGPGDHFDEIRSHAVGGMIRRMVYAKEKNIPTVTVFGTGKPVREWLYIDDAVDALLSAITAESYENIINIGAGKGYSIQETAELIKDMVGYHGTITNDTTMMDGAMEKRVDGKSGNSVLNWYPKTDFRSGLQETVSWFLENKEKYLDL